MQHFAAQTKPAQQSSRSLRSAQYNQPSKRKRAEDEDEEEHVQDNENDAGSPPPPSSAAISESPFDSLEASQLRVAGLQPGDAAEIPPKPFPHAPARSQTHNFNYTKLQESLAGLDPPLFAVNATSKSRPVGRVSEAPALRQTHLGVLTTVMHRCLLEGDFPRAGRAWGLILRSQISGSPVDPRNHGRWGIGAELLLHRKAQYNQSPSDEDSIYSPQGFELAKEYYERLIVQHPNRKYLPRVLDDLTFYPAMFSLWVYEVCEKSRRARKQLEGHRRVSASGTGFDEDTTMDDTPDMSAITAEELLQARAIASRLDQLIMSPPFDKHPDLLQLRGMVGLWLGDLILRNNAEWDGEEWNEDSNYDDDDGETPLQKVQRLAEGRTQYTKAQERLIRAQANGRHLAPTITKVETKISELSRRIEILEGG